MKHLITNEPFIKIHATVSHIELLSKKHAEFYVKQNLARQLAEHIINTVPISTLDEPEGRTYYSHVAIYNYQQLIDLATRLYTYGRLDRPTVSLNDPTDPLN